mmetsp:Transcript_147680/g.272363  ORF Transcript_147680/g.272363 Transcript_147680/m.272363 type:complete len:469 (+) Transcript_147680:133-1539(+)
MKASIRLAVVFSAVRAVALCRSTTDECNSQSSDSEDSSDAIVALQVHYSSSTIPARPDDREPGSSNMSSLLKSNAEAEVSSGQAAAATTPQAATTAMVAATTAMVAAATTTPQAATTKPLTPLIWLHVPKAGSQFATTLIHWACGSQVPQGYQTIEPHDMAPFDPKHRDCLGSTFLPPETCSLNGEVFKGTQSECSTARWNKACGNGNNSFFRFGSGHEALWRVEGITLPPKAHPSGVQYRKAFGTIKHVTDDYLPHVAVVFREPRQRIISAWNDDKHSFKRAKDLKDFAQHSKACQAQMILGIWCSAANKQGWGSGNEFLDLGNRTKGLYLDRVRRLGFIGITEEWALSVCLFHAMFGGDCLPVEFRIGRPGKAHTSRLYNTTAYGLDNLTDAEDDDVYRLGMEIFQKRMKEYGVNRESCRSTICPNAAEAFEPVSLLSPSSPGGSRIWMYRGLFTTGVMGASKSMG